MPLHAYREDLDYYEWRAYGLFESARDGTPGAVEAFRRLGAPLTRDGGRTVVASEHGFATWEELGRHVAGMRASGDPFAQAYSALEAHDVEGLVELLDRFPELVGFRGTNGNDLIGMAAATCDERLVRVLLDRGADPARGNVHGWTALHQAAYSDLPALARMLLDAGAPVDVSARGDGGTPLIVALFWGNRATAELLAGEGIHPRNLRAAAGLGDLELIDALEPAEAAAHRGFYRPHGGFPAWQPSGPSDDPQEVLDEALTWAARNDRADAVQRLVQLGANLAADVYRGTALAWAAACGKPAAISRLVALGADPNQPTTFGGAMHAEPATALHLAAENGHLEAIRLLVELGADKKWKDSIQNATPARWAEMAGHRAAADLLRA